MNQDHFQYIIEEQEWIELPFFAVGERRFVSVIWRGVRK